jgi:nitric oxide reductase NorE protein
MVDRGMAWGGKAQRARHLPGEEGVWVLITGDLIVFSLLFGLFLSYRADELSVFQQSATHLNRAFAFANTLILLTSSLLAALAVKMARRGLHAAAGRLLLGSAACGVAFCVSKAIEWSQKFAAGFTPKTDNFFMFYFMMTGIHMMHVIVGTAVLTFLWFCTRAKTHGPNYISVLEGGTAFWHFVDLIWIILVSLIYLVH